MINIINKEEEIKNFYNNFPWLSPNRPLHNKFLFETYPQLQYEVFSYIENRIDKIFKEYDNDLQTNTTAK